MPRLTGAVARSVEGTSTGHENAEGMTSVGVRVEPPVRRFDFHNCPSMRIRRVSAAAFARQSVLLR